MNKNRQRISLGSKNVMSDLAITKAAAWAWFQHGTDPLDSLEREYGITRSQLVHRSSRYKVEAEKLNAQTREGSRLLDRYEIESISKRIDQCVEVSKHEARSDHEKNGNKSKNKISITKGFAAFLFKQGIVCVPKENDVVDLAKQRNVKVVATASNVKTIRKEQAWPEKGGVGQGQLGQTREKEANCEPPSRLGQGRRKHQPKGQSQPTANIRAKVGRIMAKATRFV